MKKILLTFLFLIFSNQAHAIVNIFACEVEWANLARQIVESKAMVFLATTPIEDVTKVKANRQMAQMLKKSDMVFCNGGGVDELWLQEAINMSDNVKFAEDLNRVLFASSYFNIKTVSLGAHLNPNNILPVAKEFTRRIILLDKAHAFFYQKSYEKFAENWQRMLLTWEKKSLALKDQKVIIYDDSWLGLANWLGLKVLDKIDSGTGVKNEKQRIAELAQKFSQEKIDAIIVANHQNKTLATNLGKKIKSNVLILPFTVGSVAGSGTLQQMFSVSVNLLLNNCAKTSCKSGEVVNGVLMYGIYQQ